MRAPSDDKWRAIADDFVNEMKFDGPTRWVVARHGLSAAGNDLVHLVVQLVREDGRRLDTRREWPRAQAACNKLEHSTAWRSFRRVSGAPAVRR